MDFVARLFLYTGLFCLLLMILGLIKPWVFLWWEDIQNRRRVLKLYGSIAGVCFLIYVVLKLVS